MANRRSWAAVTVAAQMAAVVLVSSCGGTGSTPAANVTPATPTPHVRTAMTADEQAQLAQLEARPLAIPKAPSGCDGPHTPVITPYADGSTETDVFLAGPVYAQGGPERDTATRAFYFVTYYTSPQVGGVVLSRGRDLITGSPVVFAGDYAVGPVAGTDILNGVSVTLHTELAIPVAAIRPGTGAAAGWGVFPVTQGADLNWTCVGFQIDYAGGSEIAYSSRS